MCKNAMDIERYGRSTEVALNEGSSGKSFREKVSRGEAMVESNEELWVWHGHEASGQQSIGFQGGGIGGEGEDREMSKIRG